MDPQQIVHDLVAIRSVADFNAESSVLADRWAQAGAGLETVEPVLRFMESYPDIDYGMPGALVHFVERFHKQGYEDLLLQSIRRRPTWLTVWMLNRLINGTQAPSIRRQYLLALEQAGSHPQADADTVEQVRSFLDDL